jgi:hypothetical protein
VLLVLFLWTLRCPLLFLPLALLGPQLLSWSLLDLASLLLLLVSLESRLRVESLLLPLSLLLLMFHMPHVFPTFLNFLVPVVVDVPAVVGIHAVAGVPTVLNILLLWSFHQFWRPLRWGSLLFQLILVRLLPLLLV